MIKLYEGGGIYTLHLTSGKTLELTEDEINEIAAAAGIVEELHDVENELKQILNSIEEQGQYIREVEDEILPKLDECTKYIRRQSYKEEYRNILNHLEGVLGELDSLGQYI